MRAAGREQIVIELAQPGRFVHGLDQEQTMNERARHRPWEWARERMGNMGMGTPVPAGPWADSLLVLAEQQMPPHIIDNTWRYHARHGSKTRLHSRLSCRGL